MKISNQTSYNQTQPKILYFAHKTQHTCPNGNRNINWRKGEENKPTQGTFGRIWGGKYRRDLTIMRTESIHIREWYHLQSKTLRH